jgi:hypothetical protein
MNVRSGRPREPLLVTAGAYAALFAFGAVQGLIGSFQYGRMAGAVPVAALACCAAILATCLLAGWATGSVTGALVPGAGWILATFLLAMPVSNGSVIIANTTPGKWYLYGGTLSVVLGVALSFGGWVARSSPGRAAGPSSGPRPRSGRAPSRDPRG